MIGNSTPPRQKEKKNDAGLRASKRSRYGYLFKAQWFWTVLLTRTGTTEDQKNVQPMRITKDTRWKRKKKKPRCLLVPGLGLRLPWIRRQILHEVGINTDYMYSVRIRRYDAHRTRRQEDGGDRLYVDGQDDSLNRFESVCDAEGTWADREPKAEDPRALAVGGFQYGAQRQGSPRIKGRTLSIYNAALNEPHPVILLCM